MNFVTPAFSSPTPTVTAITTVTATPTPQPPTVTTGEATVDYGEGCLVTLNGTVNANGLLTTVWFEYGETSGSYGSTTATQTVSGTSDTAISNEIEVSNTYDCNIQTYYYRLVAQNNAGISYGNENSFSSCYMYLDCFGCSVSGYVTDAISGNGIENASILINGVKETVTDERGYYDCRSGSDDYHNTCGELEVTALANGYTTSTEYGYEEECSCSMTLNFKLRPISKNSIYGYILDKNNNTIESAKIILKGIKSKYKGESVSDADGYFEFTNIKKGKYFIYVSKKGYKKYKKMVELKEEETKEVEVILKDK